MLWAYSARLDFTVWHLVIGSIMEYPSGMTDVVTLLLSVLDQKFHPDCSEFCVKAWTFTNFEWNFEDGSF